MKKLIIISIGATLLTLSHYEAWQLLLPIGAMFMFIGGIESGLEIERNYPKQWKPCKKMCDEYIMSGAKKCKHI